ncbi:hypothetical protein KTR66_09795 [Roseococcus sp. SDR]|uniref:hypothetical protein n=1 Tax=Roseococcus sp. SDR TaxID=2835532 RepID=UPI001BCC5B47|nr:hypothetical protein [Roseococcus sp. SDR]MBS7790289.1 hypothetical protein [Roseococcus sp. SDR]MBV1845603.1 hypothetical protein [Roseococcus sp. SDR]
MTFHGAPRPPRSSLDLARSPTDPATLEAFRRRAWVEQGIAVISPAEITDPWLRQAIINEARRRWGHSREQR